MKHWAPIRAELGIRTIFNLLGPISNPAGVKRQVVGVFSWHWVEPIAHVLNKLGAEHVWVVHGHDGLDELTTTGATDVAEVKDGKVTVFEVTPADAGLAPAKLSDLKGGDEQTQCRRHPRCAGRQEDAAARHRLLNAAAALIVAGKAANLLDGAALAAHSIESGAAERAGQAGRHQQRAGRRRVHRQSGSARPPLRSSSRCRAAPGAQGHQGGFHVIQNYTPRPHQDRYRYCRRHAARRYRLGRRLGQRSPSRFGRLSGGRADRPVRACLRRVLGQRLGQPVVVENKPGAGGSIAAQAVKAAPADGYTLMFTISTTMIMNRVLYKNLPYDADKDFVLISSMSAGHLPLVASKATGAANLQEFVEYARKNKVSIGTYAAGSYSHIAVAELNKHSACKWKPCTIAAKRPCGRTWQRVSSRPPAAAMPPPPTFCSRVRAGRSPCRRRSA